MAIKEDALNAFFRNRPEQETLAAALDEAFDVTYGAHQFGQAFWLCQPKTFAAERFGLQRELIALYSPHARADARLLTALENISRAPEFRHRVENVVALVIYEGDRESIEGLTVQSKDWVIVAFSAKELKDRGAQTFLIRLRMADTIGRFDLFGMSSPIKHDKYFYGRDAIVQELVQRALVRKEQSGLFGLRKTGKTSVLFAIQRRLTEKGAIAEYVDCQSPGIYGSRWWAVLEELSRRMWESAAKSGCPAPTELSFDAAGAANSFIRTVKWIQDKSAVEQIVLLLDEVEFITPGIANHLGQHWDGDHLPLWQTIRSASQETKGFLTFCVAGVNPSSVEQSHFDQVPNPIFQLAVPFYLDPLTRSSVREMVRSIARYSGATLDEECFDLLSAEYGGHPYLIRLACSEVLRSLGELPVDKKVRLSKSNFDRVSDKIAIRLAQPIKDIMLSLVWWYPDEYDLLCLLAEGDTAFVQDFLASEPEKASRFARYGLLEADNGSFAIKELRTFLVKSGMEYKKAISPFTRGDLPLEYLPQEPNIADLAALFERRTEVEYALRKLLITVLEYRFAFDEAKVASAISGALPKNNGDREMCRPMQEDTLFRLASLTKPIVSAAALALTARNVLALDEPIASWLPSFRPRTKSGERPDILVRHLLTHTAGLDYGFGEFRNLFINLGIGNGLDHPGLGFADQLARLAEVPLKFDPGHGWGYSLATDVLGAVIAEAATTTLPDVVKQHVTLPLKMRDTTFWPRDADALAVPYADAVPRPMRMSDPHELPIGGGRVRFSPSRVSNSDSFPSGGAGMVGTASDFMTFLEAIRLGGSPILDPVHAALMTTDQLPEAADFPEAGWRFGMGAAVLCDPTVTRTPHDAGTWRWSGGYGHDWFVNPRRALTVVSMTNTAFEGSDGAFPLNLRDAIYYALGSS